MSTPVSGRRLAGVLVGWVLSVGLATSASAQGQFIEDIRVSRQGDEAELTIEMACPMRFVSDVATTAGVLIEIRVSPLDDCRQLGLGAGLASEAYRPLGGQLAHLDEVEYESLGLGENLLLLRFDRAVEYRVTQRGNLRTLRVTIQLDETTAPVVAERAPAISAPPAPAPQVEPSVTDRTPLLPQIREPETAADYIVNLQSTRERVTNDTIESIDIPSGRRIYVSEITVDGTAWYRLRVGFFASEELARAALETLAERFPRAWIGRADPDEVQLASSTEFTRGSLVQAEQEAARTVGMAQAAAAGQAESLDAAEIAVMMAEAREHMLDENFGDAIALYTRLLQEAGAHQLEAREYLGVAHEKEARVGQARAEYQAYLDTFPSADGVQRVRQRLNGLMTTLEVPRAALRAAPSAEQGRWAISSGISQYYRRDVNQFSEELDEVVSLSALFNDIDLRIQRSGENVDLLGRITASYLHDMIDEPGRRDLDPNRVSYAYLDLNTLEGALSIRAGRQSLHHLGVLGRFDGLHASYDWAPQRRVHFTTGYPVDSTRYSLDTTREFVGAAVEFLDVNDHWDFGSFVTRQTLEGVDDRQAVGLEAHYVDARRTLTSMVEYETSFGELNSVLVLGTWRFDNQITLSAHADFRMSPILTLRNALIGQPVSTLEELMLVWTEEEIRQLARDRTSRSDTVTIGVSMPLTERFQLNADVTMTEYGASTESGGVLAVPGTGAQTYYSTSFVGSGLFGGNGVTIVNVRHGQGDDFQSTQLTWDVRVAVGRFLRLNPRLRLASWKGVLDGRVRETISPSLRLLFNPRKRYRLEFEFGTDRRSFSSLNSDTVSSGRFINLGYRADF